MMDTYLVTEHKLEAIEAIQPILRKSPEVSSEEFQEFLDYKISLGARQRIYRNFTDEEGNFTMFEKATKNDKDALNDLSTEVHEYELKMKGTPIFDMLEKEMNVKLPEFLTRDDIGRFIPEKIAVGWYQNSRGDLYHYDGVVWDNVPNEKVSDLEFLGN